MNIKGIALALLLGASLATGARAAQSLNPLGGVIIGTPGSGQSLQNYTFSCSVSGCATGSVEPALELTQGGAFLSVTNGLYSNLLQGNAALSATNGLFANLLQGNAVIASGNPLFITGTGTAGAAAAGVQTVQGIASMTPLLTNPGTAASWALFADNSAFTIGTSLGAPFECEFTTGGATAITTARVGVVGCTAARGLFIDKSSVGGTALTAAVSAYGTAPTGTAVEGVNAFITNTNANLATNADAIAAVAAGAAGAGSPVNATLYGFNGTTFDRLVVDASKFLKVNCSAGCSSSTSITSWAGGTLGAMSNFGTTPTAVLVPGMNASLFLGTTAAAAGHGTAATALRVELPTDGTGVVGLNAGAALIGKVGIDQTTVGTTNAVSVAQIGATTVLTGTGAVGTGAQRIAVGTDTATIAGSSPASAGFVATGSAPPTGSQYLSVLEGAATTGGKATAPINCDNHVFKHITTATDTNAVTGVTGQAIYICSWRSRAAGVATWFLETSANTSGTCGTPTQISGVATEAANTGETWGSNFWSGLKSAAANGVCINSTGTGGVDVDIWYTQL